jgi:hypothetical protein
MAVVMAAAGLAAAGCTDQTVPAPTQPTSLSPSFSGVTSSQLKTDLDALLKEPARTAARFQMSRIEQDLLLKRRTAYLSTFVLTGIPLIERKLGRIPEEKLELLLKVLCEIWTLYGDRLVAMGFPAVDLCRFTPETFKNSTTQVILNSQDNVVTNPDGTGAAYVRAGSLTDAATGQPLDAALFVMIDIAETPGRACPFPTNLDCYGDEIDRFTQPDSRYDGTLAICAPPPGTLEDGAPTTTVEGRVKGYGFNPQSGEFEFMERDTRSDIPPGLGKCDEEPGHTDIGSIGFDRAGLRNGLLALRRSASKALHVFLPTTLHALNVPWHIADDGGIGLGSVGDQIGMVDPVVRVDKVEVSPQSPSIFVGSTVQLSRTLFDKRGDAISDPTSLQGTSWSSSNSAVAEASASGLVTGRGAGTAVITATVGTGEGLAIDGKTTKTVSATTTVTVTQAPTPGADILVFNDLNMFQVSNANNNKLYENLAGFSGPGARATQTGVLFVYGHGNTCATATNDECDVNGGSTFFEDGTGNKIYASWWHLKTTLTGLSYTVATTDQTLDAIASNIKVVFLVLPRSAYTNAEINALKQFASEGGRIIFVGEHAGYYANGIPIENDFLVKMGAQMTNVGGEIDCGFNNLPASVLRVHQVTTGMNGITIACASEVDPGPNDYALFYDRSNALVLGAVAKVDVSPLPALNMVATLPLSTRAGAPNTSTMSRAAQSWGSGPRKAPRPRVGSRTR